MQATIRDVPALDLLLNKENPRHVPKRDQAEIIACLLEDEKVYNLARHISGHGLNPLEIIAVFTDRNGNLTVAEGNRRVCALQLLNDPDRAPTAYKKRFRALAAGIVPQQIRIAEFESYDEAQPWLEVLHDGEQDGVGRKQWRAEQKARATLRPNRDILALSLFDHAKRKGFLTDQGRRGISLTTATRYLGNPDVRAAIGITTSPSDATVKIDVNQATFDNALVRFLKDLTTGKITSRSAAKDWKKYAVDIRTSFDTSNNRVEPYDLSAAVPEDDDEASDVKRHRKTPIPKTIPRSDEIQQQLNRISSLKLGSLYQSLTTLRLSEHPAIIVTGSWVFIEIITAAHGRANCDFLSYLSSKITSWSFSKDQKRDITASVRYISENGNAEKHSAMFTTLSAENLINHFHILDQVIVKILSEIQANKS